MDPDLFFPIGTTGPAEPQIRRAKRICSLCPVQAECLAYGMTQSDGIWGGTTDTERRTLRRRESRRARERVA
jgi:WhiB family redox-sensing transcriptional regulator